MMNVGAAPSAQPHPSAPIDAEAVVYRLEEAGRTLLALPNTGYTTRLRTSTLDIVRTALECYGWDAAHGEQSRIRPAVPDSARIDRMDEALGWIALIPQDRYVLRRIVGARALVSPVTERHLYAWRRLAKVLGADHKAVQRWHAQAIDLIVASINRPAIQAVIANRARTTRPTISATPPASVRRASVERRRFG